MADSRLAKIRLHAAGLPCPFVRPSLFSRCATLGLGALAGFLHGPSALAQTAPFSGEVALTSQLVDRGRAVTSQTGVLQAAGDWIPSTGWSIGASASTKLDSPGRVVEAMVQGARYWSLSDSWQLQAGLIYYDYPTNHQLKFYERVEGGLAVSYRDILTVGVSEAHLVHSDYETNRAALDISARWPLPGGFSVLGGVGVAQSYVAPYKSYRYGQVGLAWTHGPWRIELDRVYARREWLPVWRDLNPSPWLGTVSVAF